MQTRKLKAYPGMGTNPDYPRIQLQGKWLRNLGFEPGDTVSVSAIAEYETDGYALVIRKKTKE